MSDYGTAAGVARIASTWTIDGEFNTETNPNLTTITAWLDSMSSLMNLALKNNHFTTPVSDTDSVVSFAAVSEFVNLLVADLVAARNQTGRFIKIGSTGQTDSTSWIEIQKEIDAWIKLNANAFIADAVPQITTNPIRTGQRAVILLDTDTAI